MKKSIKPKQKAGKFEKFDRAEKEIKEAEDAVLELSEDIRNEKDKDLIVRAARDLERAEAEVEEADEDSF